MLLVFLPAMVIFKAMSVWSKSVVGIGRNVLEGITNIEYPVRGFKACTLG